MFFSLLFLKLAVFGDYWDDFFVLGMFITYQYNDKMMHIITGNILIIRTHRYWKSQRYYSPMPTLIDMKQR